MLASVVILSTNKSHISDVLINMCGRGSCLLSLKKIKIKVPGLTRQYRINCLLRITAIFHLRAEFTMCQQYYHIVDISFHQLCDFVLNCRHRYSVVVIKKVQNQ